MNAGCSPVPDGRKVLARAVRRAGPACFPMVMATGIVSVALRQAGQPSWSAALLVIAAAAFVILLAASVVRGVSFPADLREDLGRPDRAFASFAFVAACGVLGDRLAGLQLGTAARLPLVDRIGTVAVWAAAAAWALTFIGLAAWPFTRRPVRQDRSELGRVTM
jgi:tellurite resistance protein TehA-like permease